MYKIGTDREKWLNPQRNAQIGDVVLLKDKNLPRLEWSTGTIISVTPDKDTLVRRVMVKPHKRPNQTLDPAPRERAIHDLVLIKSITSPDHPHQDSSQQKDAPEEASAFRTSFQVLERGIFPSIPDKLPKSQNHNPIGSQYSCIQQPTKMIEPIPEKDITFLQSTSDAILQRISDIRKNSLNTKNPNSIPLNQPSNCYPKLEWDKHYIHSYLDQGHLKHQLKGRPSNVPQDKDVLQTEPLKSKDSQKLQPSSKTSFITQEQKKKQVHWKPQISKIKYIEPSGKMKPTKTTTALSRELSSLERSSETERSKLWRDQITDLSTTLYLLFSKNENKDPHCPSPRYFYTKDGLIKRETPSSNLLSQIFLPTSQYKTILQRPHPPATNTNSQQTSLKTTKTKSFEQRQMEYYQIRAKIFGTKTSPYNIRPP